MASGFINSAGLDLDSVFAPLHSGWPQAAATDFFDGNGNDLNLRYAPLSTGSAAAVTDFLFSSGADLNTVFAAYGSTGVQVASQPGNVSGATAAGSPSGTVTSSSTSCAGTKGGGTYTYTWILASGSGVSFTAPNSTTTAVTGTVPAGQTISGTMYCNISDGVTSVNTGVVSWSIQNTTPAFTGAQHVYTASGSGTETVPPGATNVVIESQGGGVGGGTGITQSGVPKPTYGGGAGGYSRSTYTCSGGQTLAYVVGAGGAPANNGTASTVSSGSLGITTMSANTGNFAQGGTASGGNQVNQTGGGGNPTASSIPPAGEYFNTGQAYGAGGHSGSGAGNLGAPGTGGYVSFYYPA